MFADCLSVWLRRDPVPPWDVPFPNRDGRRTNAKENPYGGGTLHASLMEAAPLTCHLFPAATGIATGTDVFRSVALRLTWYRATLH
jgi:hypothetical protein